MVEEFEEDKETPEAIVEHYNACGYTPETVPIDSQFSKVTGRWELKTAWDVYWDGKKWAVWKG